MKLFSIGLVLLCCSTALAQRRFDIKDASTRYDVRIAVAQCDNNICEGKVTFTLFRKGERQPFQTFRLSDTEFPLEENQHPLANRTMLYDEQSAFNFGDFNFDGTDDLALCDGRNGGYGMPSYQIYLFSPQANKFVHSPALTRLAQEESLGMFEVDKKRRVLKTFSKSGCCYHVTQEFAVVNNRPLKMLEIIEDATIANDTKVKITTRKRVQGRWQTKIKYVPRKEEN